MKTLFAVDDDVAMLQMMAKALLPYEYEMTWTGGVTGALVKMHSVMPEIIILDVMMPDGGGYPLARAIRADSGLYKIPILFASCMGDAPEVDHALKQGGDSYLLKPFSLKELLDKLQALEELTARIKRVHPDTGLLALEAIEREVDHKIFRKERFALCYMAFDNYEPFLAVKGAGEGLRLVRWFAQLLQETLKQQGLGEACTGYLGRDYFLAMVEEEQCEHFCQALSRAFDHGVQPFYTRDESAGCHVVLERHPGVVTSHPLMTLRIEGALQENGNFSNSHDMLHFLQQSMKNRDHRPDRRSFRWEGKSGARREA